ncbi:MAG: DASS family sodium-coupled anion symporter [Candidatus Hydrogenedens sp.]|nr:DASS family sodium-coupled anion symporter [Candidatus Hydrogenedens sp.]
MASNGRGNRWRQEAMVWLPLVLCALLLAFADFSPGNPLITRTAAVALLMAAWWITGAIPLAATALLPVALFPVLGIMNAADAASNYVNDIIFLYIGGFLVALAMQRWNLHRRIALGMLLLCGTRPRALLAGFMLPTFFLSMFISNTATTMMMAPIALAVLADLEERGSAGVRGGFGVGLLLAIAYCASIGGTATLIGTPPNLSFARILEITFPEAPHISFAQWFVFGFPLAVSMAVLLWALISWMYARGVSEPFDRRVIAGQYRALGPWSFEQRAMLLAFGALGILWMTRSDVDLGALQVPGWSTLFEYPAYLRDGTVAIAVASILFLVPAPSEPGRRLLDWDTAKTLRWDIVLLYGGGFALANAFVTSGLSAWLGDGMSGLAGLPPVALVFTLCLGISLLTELTSNTATTEMALPILAALAVGIGVHPLLLMLPATLACSCAFMLPVATPPNAIVFGAGNLTIAQMARTGFLLNLAAVVLITALTFLLGPLVFGIGAGGGMPEWAVLSGGGH